MLCINFEHGPCFCVNKTPNVTADTIKTIIGEMNIILKKALVDYIW